MVFAAASLNNRLGRSQSRASGAKSGSLRDRSSYAASNVLAKRIEAGSAGRCVRVGGSRLDGLRADQRDLIRPDSRVNLLGNTLVLIAPKKSDISR